MPDATGGLSGLVGQIADALGGLFDGMPDTPVADDNPVLDDPVDQSGDKPEEDKTEEAVPEDVPVAEEAAEGEVHPSDEPTVTDTEPTEAVSPPPPEPPPVEPPEPPDEQTPCEIAADELAQVGQ